MIQPLSVRSESTINILVTLDRKYIEPLSVMLDSYGILHSDMETNLYVAHSSLTEEDMAHLQERTKNYKISIHNVVIAEHWFADTPVLERLPEESFYRLMAFHYLPKEIHRCLYLDPDIIIRQSLLPLYFMDIGEHYIAAASHMYGAKNKFNKLRLGITENKRYINSGVMLMNLDAMRCDFTLDSVLDCLNENIQKLWLGDQDIINIIFDGNTQLVDEKIYNLDERTFKHNQASFDLQQVEQQTAIIHYNGKYKPWLSGYKGMLDRFYPQTSDKEVAPAGKWKSQIKAFHNIIRMNTKQKIILGGVLGSVFICFICWLFFGKSIVRIVSEPQLFRDWLNQYGTFDELVFILIRAVQTVVKIIPAEPLEIASGYAWGAIPGMLYCVIGNMLGTLAILFLTRHFGQQLVERIVPVKNRKALMLFQNSEKIYVLLFFLYLIPGSPKDGFTYLVGLLQVKTVPFMIITFIARIPSVLSSTLCGSALADKQYLIFIIIFAVTAILAIWGGIIYNKYIKKINSVT